MFQLDLIAPIGDLLGRQAAKAATKIAYQDATRGVTYGDLQHRTRNLAGHLADNGVQSGDCVAILLPNSVNWVESCFGIVRAGGIAVPISIEASESEILYRLTDAKCRAVITTAAIATTVRTIAATAKIDLLVVPTGPAEEGDASFDNWSQSPAPAPARDPLDIDATAFIVYTSGTTGQPKGVQLSLRNLLWVTAACWSPILGLNDQDKLLSPLPLYHSYALNLTVISILATGASIHLMEKYSTREAVDLLGSGDFTIFPAVPTIFHYLLDTARNGQVTLPGIRACVTAGAIMAGTANAEFEANFGVPLLDGYGITETATMVTMNSATGGRIMGSCGLPIHGLAVRIVDPVTLKDCAPGEEGELIVRGPSVMAGYLNKPEETAKALRDGWYHSGDLACADANGFLTITGRIKELIIRGGQNIAPAEIEEVVQTLDIVLDCAVVGLPHAHLGEVPGLFIIPRDKEFDEAVVIDHCRAHLSSYKVPQVIHIVTEIPRTGSGKIIRYKLRELVS
ncbi:class I adenylate-forming enzyme family protein [Novosphingobium sp. KN65.2]|uniref:class I adenylate-forming enzyme family protein n=1 Tax=Novosphingobium sp. KN65.2 TaxID=1478134 RepID=UPI0005E45203|nr:class I adenylate-forming enzyme family protein [Novosphingobium sp. KN65.2]CDO36443.1 Long-chain-fatty-acid--CoA ligase [Novosphingobium sp. KN65.2]